MLGTSSHRRDPLLLILTGIGAVVAVVLFWQLSQVLLLLFAAILVATVLRTFAGAASRYLKLPLRLALALVAVAIACLVAGVIYLLGTEFAAQFDNLSVRISSALGAIGRQVGVPDLAQRSMGLLSDVIQRDTLLGDLAARVGKAVALLSTAILVITAGTYLAVDPDLYRRGIVGLVPPRYQSAVDRALAGAGRQLRRWLSGQLLSMLAIGLMTALALSVIGLPSALALGMIAGVLEFIPYVGEILGIVPALVLATSTGDPYTVLWVAGAYILIQQVEGNVLSPLVQQLVVRLPPVLGLFALIGFGVLFGPLGVIVATPLTLVGLVVVKEISGSRRAPEGAPSSQQVHMES